ncbi:uncharacterized protein LOC106669679 [Cimex lectularius]|uniref:Salivary OBP n=1 Tax=Cimex lectularius TaxID=79782 RepID=A0A8I6S2J2_CIMLE|nr:uncharacterized protein LOC106669679 [Cimex lectularius]
MVKTVILSSMLLSVAFAAVVERSVETSTPAVVNPCKCGVMTSSKPDSVPVLEHEVKLKELSITCDNEGKAKCERMCKVLAEAAKVDKNKGNKFCEAVKKDITLTPSLFTSVCNEKYSYAGVTFDKPVCCKKGVLVPCEPAA